MEIGMNSGGLGMNEQIDQLNQWLAGLDSKHPAKWDLLPDIGLYMDQVQTYIDRQLVLYRRDENDRLLTPAMINNYIKDNLIPRAEAKKYNPAHLALLIMIGTLKQVMSIPNLTQLLSTIRSAEDVEALYDHFLQIQRDSLKGNAGQVLHETQTLLTSENESEASADKASETALRNLALELGIEARTRILIAEKIISLLAESEKDKEKKKDKKNVIKPADSENFKYGRTLKTLQYVMAHW
jgi:hypothetical protein